LAIISCGNGEEEVDVAAVDVVAVDDEAELLEAIAVWFPPACVTVFVRVFVTVGVVVCASTGEGGLPGEKSDLVTEAMPASIETMPKVRPALSRFLRVMLRSSEATPFDWASFLFDSSSTAAMGFSSPGWSSGFGIKCSGLGS